jgi:hypothetical protein
MSPRVLTPSRRACLCQVRSRSPSPPRRPRADRGHVAQKLGQWHPHRYDTIRPFSKTWKLPCGAVAA